MLCPHVRCQRWGLDGTQHSLTRYLTVSDIIFHSMIFEFWESMEKYLSMPHDIRSYDSKIRDCCQANCDKKLYERYRFSIRCLSSRLIQHTIALINFISDSVFARRMKSICDDLSPNVTVLSVSCFQTLWIHGKVARSPKDLRLNNWCMVYPPCRHNYPHHPRPHSSPIMADPCPHPSPIRETRSQIRML